MRTPILALTVSAIALAGCGESRLNPFNWFKKTEEEVVVVQPSEFSAEDLVEQVVDLQISKTATGAIIYATGLPPTQGYWGAELIAMNDAQPVDGVITYRFEAIEPVGFERVVNQRSREVLAASNLSNADLEGVTAIRVISATNALIKRR